MKSYGSAWGGWVLFAGVMLLVIGGVNIVEGIVALVQSTQVVLVANRLYLVDLTSWGWVLLISGLVLGATGLGLLFGQTWARIVGVIVVSLHAIAQVMWIGAYPIWSLLMIALDTVVIFALTARWSVALDEDESTMDSPPVATHRVPAS